jgi:hypothetical protein
MPTIFSIHLPSGAHLPKNVMVYLAISRSKLLNGVHENSSAGSTFVAGFLIVVTTEKASIIESENR